MTRAQPVALFSWRARCRKCSAILKGRTRPLIDAERALHTRQTRHLTDAPIRIGTVEGTEP